MPMLAFEVKRRLKNIVAVKIIIGIIIAFSAFMVTGRLVSGEVIGLSIFLEGCF